MIEDWWDDRVKKIYRDALAELGGDSDPLDYGPGHIVWADDNFDDDSVRFSIDACENRRDEWLAKFGESNLLIARKALEQMLAVSESERGNDPQFPCEEDLT